MRGERGEGREEIKKMRKEVTCKGGKRKDHNSKDSSHRPSWYCTSWGCQSMAGSPHRPNLNFKSKKYKNKKKE